MHLAEISGVSRGPYLAEGGRVYSLSQTCSMRRCAPCSSSVVLPLLPKWLDKAIAIGVLAVALTAVAGAAVGVL
jgi:hypothetical protein